MEELLREFCELAPKEWGAKIDEYYAPKCETWVKLYSYPVIEDHTFSGYAATIDLKDDQFSSFALVLLLDWLEGQGWFVQLNNAWYDGPIGYDLKIEKYTPKTTTIELLGTTRIEAVLRACVSVLREQEEEEK